MHLARIMEKLWRLKQNKEDFVRLYSYPYVNPDDETLERIMQIGADDETFVNILDVMYRVLCGLEDFRQSWTHITKENISEYPIRMQIGLMENRNPEVLFPKFVDHFAKRYNENPEGHSPETEPTIETNIYA